LVIVRLLLIFKFRSKDPSSSSAAAAVVVAGEDGVVTKSGGDLNLILANYRKLIVQ
jgi:hypothetical protein